MISLGKPINVLMVEDSPVDAELVLRQLEKGGFEPTHERVDTAPALASSLERHCKEKPFDIVMADYNLPQLNALEALRMVRDCCPEIPVIVVSGSIGEETAVQAMKAGVNDYVMKDNLARLVPAVERELYEAQERAKRRKLEQEAHERATLLDIANDAIMVRDLQGHFLYWNKGAERLYGWTLEELRGKTVTEVFGAHPQSEEVTKTLLEKGYWTGELRQKTKDGREIVVQSSRTLVRSEDGSPKAVFVVNSDITERKSLEAQFLRAQRMESLGTLASGIAHDLNNVLAPILMSVDVLKGKVSDEEGARMLEILETSVRRGAELVKQILFFGRGAGGERGVLRLGNILEDVKKLISETFNKNIEVSVASEPNLWPVIGDKTQLHQVLMNLCVNARDAMPEGGSLSVYAENIYIDANYARLHLEARVGPYVVISVSDTGKGIPPEYVGRVFEPFFTTKEAGKGTGLGLSTAYTIVRSHGGFINVYSEVGKGTRMRVYIPATEVPETEITYLPSKRIPQGKGETIMVVDDESSVLEMTRITLEAHGYKVLSASDGEEALTLFRAHSKAISLILLDMMIPGMDGVSTAKAILRLDPQANILIATGLAVPKKMEQLEDLPIKGTLEKPFDAPRLLTAIAKVLGGAEA